MNDHKINIQIKSGDEEDDRKVYVDGDYIGDIYQRWASVGGEGWTFGSDAATYKTQREAARALNYRRKQDDCT